MAARLAPDNVRRIHQSLHHVVADAPWSDAAVLAEVRGYAWTAMRQRGPVEAWIVDDTGFPKKGTHSVGVVRQYCGQVGKPVDQHASGEPSDCLAFVFAARVGRRPSAQKAGWSSRGSPV